MTTVITEEDLKVKANKTIFDTETQVQIRKKLKEAVGYNSTEHTLNNFGPETHHDDMVPFEGSVYVEAGNSLNTKAIDSMYRKSLPSLWWLVSQSLVAFFRRVIH